MTAPVTTPSPPTSSDRHGWRLVAPWYRWERRDGAEPERAAGAGRPALHKYTSTDFVAEFLADPQRSVLFGTVDEQQRIESIPHVPLPGDPLERRRFLATKRAVPTGVRKLFRPAHSRHYLVAIGLHCDEPGFPRVEPARVAEAGFVVRRQSVPIPDGKQAQAAALLAELARARAVASTKQGFEASRARGRLLHPFGSAARGRVDDPAAAATAAARDVALARRKLHAWADAVGAERRTEGWVPTGDGSFGAWVAMDDEPAELIERTYPMRALRPPPGDPDHAALDGTIFWGAVPTASDEITVDGSTRFSELSLYEIRAFVRRDLGACPGPPIWSAPSEPFHLASFFDPDGAAQRPVEINLPDFAALEASTALPAVKMNAPPNSSFTFDENGEIPTDGSVQSGREICFFALPLITIVATFVLKLFLPIVTFVFGLFFLLKLKFCIPPSVSLEADLSAELDVVPGGIQASLSVDIDVDFGVDGPALEGKLRTGLDADRPGQELGTRLTLDYTNDPIVELLASQGYGVPPEEPFPVFALPLTHTTAVTRDQVVHP